MALLCALQHSLSLSLAFQSQPHGWIRELCLCLLNEMGEGRRGVVQGDWNRRREKGNWGELLRGWDRNYEWREEKNRREIREEEIHSERQTGRRQLEREKSMERRREEKKRVNIRRSPFNLPYDTQQRESTTEILFQLQLWFILGCTESNGTQDGMNTPTRIVNFLCCQLQPPKYTKMGEPKQEKRKLTPSYRWAIDRCPTVLLPGRFDWEIRKWGRNRPWASADHCNWEKVKMRMRWIRNCNFKCE